MGIRVFPGVVDRFDHFVVKIINKQLKSYQLLVLFTKHCQVSGICYGITGVRLESQVQSQSQ